MVYGFGELTCLRTLPLFVVPSLGNNGGAHSLGGKLSTTCPLMNNNGGAWKQIENYGDQPVFTIVEIVFSNLLQNTGLFV